MHGVYPWLNKHLVNHDYFITFKNREYTKGLSEFLLRSTIIIIWNEKCALDEDR